MHREPNTEQLRNGQRVVWVHSGRTTAATVVRVTETRVEIVCQDANGDMELRCVPLTEIQPREETDAPVD